MKTGWSGSQKAGKVGPEGSPLDRGVGGGRKGKKKTQRERTAKADPVGLV